MSMYLEKDSGRLERRMKKHTKNRGDRGDQKKKAESEKNKKV